MELMYDRAAESGHRRKADDTVPVQRKAARVAEADLSSPIQRKHAYRRSLEGNPGVAGAMAQAGLSGGKSRLPHLDKIQAAFGRHDVGNVEAHVGGPAQKACDGMMAHAYATGGNSIAFRQQPNLHVAAHEAAHIVQQRSGIDIPKGLTPQEHDLETEADQVADAVVQGKSAERILDKYTGPPAGPTAGSPDTQRPGRTGSASSLAAAAAGDGTTRADARSGVPRTERESAGMGTERPNPTEEVRHGARSTVENWSSFDPARVPAKLRKPKARAIRRQDIEEPLVHHAKPRTKATKHTVNQYDPRPGKTSINEADGRPTSVNEVPANGSERAPGETTVNEYDDRAGSVTVNEYIEEPGKTTVNELHAEP